MSLLMVTWTSTWNNIKYLTVLTHISDISFVRSLDLWIKGIDCRWIKIDIIGPLIFVPIVVKFFPSVKNTYYSLEIFQILQLQISWFVCDFCFHPIRSFIHILYREKINTILEKEIKLIKSIRVRLLKFVPDVKKNKNLEIIFSANSVKMRS